MVSHNSTPISYFLATLKDLKVSKLGLEPGLVKEILSPGGFSSLRAKRFSRMLGKALKRHSHGVKGSILYGHSPTRAAAHASGILDTRHVRGGAPTQAAVRC